MPAKIGLYLPSLSGGGAERVMLNLAAGLIERELEVDLVLAKAGGPMQAQTPSGVRVVDLRSTRVSSSLPGLIRYLRRERPVALLSAMSHANIIAILARRLANCRVRLAISEHNTLSVATSNAHDLRNRLMPRLMKVFYPCADAVVAVSRGVADDLAQTAGFPADKISIIFNPVIHPGLISMGDEIVDHPWFATGTPPVLLGVGRLTAQKDFSVLIRAFSIVRKQLEARLLILGEGEERHRLEALVRDMDLKDDVSLPGFVDNPYKFIKRAAVFVLSSRWEGLPTVLIESMALGTPVISTDCPSGPAEILDEGRWGLLVPVGDEEALAAAIRQTLSHPGRRASQLFCERFTIDAAVGHYLELLQVEPPLSNKIRPVR